jgi:hypothetical protein
MGIPTAILDPKQTPALFQTIDYPNHDTSFLGERNPVAFEQLPLKRDVPKSLPGQRASRLPSAGTSSVRRLSFSVLRLRLEFEGVWVPLLQWHAHVLAQPQGNTLTNITRRTLVNGGTAMATAGALTGSALLDWSKAWAQTAPWKPELAEHPQREAIRQPGSPRCNRAASPRAFRARVGVRQSRRGSARSSPLCTGTSSGQQNRSERRSRTYGVLHRFFRSGGISLSD